MDPSNQFDTWSSSFNAFPTATGTSSASHHDAYAGNQDESAPGHVAYYPSRSTPLEHEYNWPFPRQLSRSMSRGDVIQGSVDTFTPDFSDMAHTAGIHYPSIPAAPGQFPGSTESLASATASGMVASSDISLRQHYHPGFGAPQYESYQAPQNADYALATTAHQVDDSYDPLAPFGFILDGDVSSSSTASRPDRTFSSSPMNAATSDRATMSTSLDSFGTLTSVMDSRRHETMAERPRYPRRWSSRSAPYPSYPYYGDQSKSFGMDPSLHLGPSSAFDIERPASSRSETASVGSSNRSSVSPGRAPSSCSTHSASVSEAGSDHAAALSSVAEENLVVPGIDGRPFRVAKLKVTSNATRAASERRRTKDAIFACPIESCGKRFTTKNNLIGHVTAHQGLKPRKCPFPGCDQAFARQSDCKRHERKHYEKAM